MSEFIPPATSFIELPTAFAMKRGGVLHGARIAYETWGRPNPARDNAVLILTGLSPNAHAATHDDDPAPGWWEATRRASGVTVASRNPVQRSTSLASWK